MHKAKRFKKNNKKIIITSLVSVVIVSGTVIAVSTFNNQKNDTPVKNTAVLTSDNLDENQAVEVIQPKKDNVAKPTSADEKDLTENKDLIQIPAVGTNFSEWNKSCSANLVVINKDNPITDDYKVNIVDYKDIKINANIKNDLDNIIKAAAKDGLKIYPSSGYRSIARQTTLFNNQVEKFKNKGFKNVNAEIKAATVVAKPKTSEHHTGLAIDFNGVRDDFFKTKEYAWLIKNAADYGFILRYPKNKTDITNVIYEPWHFRYVGKAHATKIAKSDLYYEEYIQKIMKK